ncbi:MAG: disulfide bond formation protein B [Salinarimonas sp.]|nr:disulfide bond formation protein B [Salinarimonas sp.]
MIDAGIARSLNALALIAISAILAAAFYTQIVARELPCPLCILQRAGFVVVGLGLAMNLLIGPRPGHYALMILAALAGGAVSLRQMALHIVPGTGAYGDPVLGLHLYSWAALIFAAIILGAALMLFFEKQFRPSAGEGTRGPLILAALAFFALMALGNGASTLLECGTGLCPDDPVAYEWLPG